MTKYYKHKINKEDIFESYEFTLTEYLDTKKRIVMYIRIIASDGDNVPVFFFEETDLDEITDKNEIETLKLLYSNS